MVKKKVVKVLTPSLKQRIDKVSLQQQGVQIPIWTYTKVIGTTLKGLIKFEITQSSKENNANTGFAGGPAGKKPPVNAGDMWFNP